METDSTLFPNEIPKANNNRKGSTMKVSEAIELEAVGMALDNEGLVCLVCADYFQDEATREGKTLEFTPSYEIGNPDGYTCANCGDEWYPINYNKGEQQ